MTDDYIFTSVHFPGSRFRYVLDIYYHSLKTELVDDYLCALNLLSKFESVRNVSLSQICKDFHWSKSENSLKNQWKSLMIGLSDTLLTNSNFWIIHMQGWINFQRMKTKVAQKCIAKICFMLKGNDPPHLLPNPKIVNSCFFHFLNYHFNPCLWRPEVSHVNHMGKNQFLRFVESFFRVWENIRGKYRGL